MFAMRHNSDTVRLRGDEGSFTGSHRSSEVHGKELAVPAVNFAAPRALEDYTSVTLNASDPYASESGGGGDSPATTESPLPAPTLTTAYVCDRFLPPDEIVREMTLQFDYEAAVQHHGSDGTETSVQDFLQDDLPGLEAGMLWALSDAVGMLPCRLSVPQDAISSSSYESIPNDGGGRHRQLQNRQLKGDITLVRISSEPTDYVDPTVDSCQWLDNMPDDMLCVPMTGRMTVEYIGDDPEVAHSFLMEQLRDQIDAQRVLVGNVLESLYLGDRSTFVPTGSYYYSSRTNSSSSNEPTVLAASVSAGALAIVVLAFAFAIRRRRGKEEGEVGGSSAAVACEAALELPLGNDSGSTARDSSQERNRPEALAHSSPRRKHVAPDVEDECFQPVPAPGMPTLVLPDGDRVSPTSSLCSSNATAKSNESDKNAADSQLDRKIAKAKSTTVSSTEIAAAPLSEQNRSVTSISHDAIAEQLPPLPPNVRGPSPHRGPSPNQGGRSESLKKKRKKKKKPKKHHKIKLVRVNSRESINEMDVIPEGADEEGDVADDASSYYSTDDEDSHGRASRDPSPAASVRSSSSGGGSATNDAPNVPSPIAEEKKVPRLPPPFV